MEIFTKSELHALTIEGYKYEQNFKPFFTHQQIEHFKTENGIIYFYVILGGDNDVDFAISESHFKQWAIANGIIDTWTEKVYIDDYGYMNHRFYDESEMALIMQSDKELMKYIIDNPDKIWRHYESE